jgi:gluconate 2-dehydrogenase gamma chain
VYQITRRHLLGSSAMALLLGRTSVWAAVVKGGLPWKPGSGDPPAIVTPEGWQFLTPDEGATVEAFVDRLIPPDPRTPGGKDAGCAVFIDRQLAGRYGRSESDYMQGPFQDGTEQQGPQSPVTPAQHYRIALAAFDKACRAKFGGKRFVELAEAQKDEAIKGLEDGSFALEGTNAKAFFRLILQDTQNGFFADPIYGGNRDMVAWKMIGFPGAHYDYRDWIDKHNQRVTLPPVGISNHPNWSQ